MQIPIDIHREFLPGKKRQLIALNEISLIKVFEIQGDRRIELRKPLPPNHHRTGNVCGVLENIIKRVLTRELNMNDLFSRYSDTIRKLLNFGDLNRKNVRRIYSYRQRLIAPERDDGKKNR